MTYDTLDEVEGAYRELVSIQKKLRTELRSGDGTDWSSVNDLLDRQQTIIAEIEASGTLDERFQSERPERFETLINDYREGHDEVLQEVRERKDEFEKQFESLDQSEDLLDQYQQSSDSSYHIDETI